MLKMLAKVLAAGTMGVLTIVGAYLALALHQWPVVMSNAALVAWLAVPIVAGAIVSVLVYRLLDG